jgi:hypothetical protein
MPWILGDSLKGKVCSDGLLYPWKGASPYSFFDYNQGAIVGLFNIENLPASIRPLPDVAN